MRVIKAIIMLLVVFLFVSCGQKIPECADEGIKTSVLKIYYDILQHNNNKGYRIDSNGFDLWGIKKTKAEIENLVLSSNNGKVNGIYDLFQKRHHDVGELKFITTEKSSSKERKCSCEFQLIRKVGWAGDENFQGESELKIPMTYRVYRDDSGEVMIHLSLQRQ